MDKVSFSRSRLERLRRLEAAILVIRIGWDRPTIELWGRACCNREVAKTSVPPTDVHLPPFFTI